MQFTAGVYLNGFERMVGRTIETLEFGVRDAVRNAAEEGAGKARQSGRFQNRTGNLRAGIVARFVRSNVSSATWEILSPAPYSKFLEQGTRPHEIRAKNAQALRWVSKGTEHFAKVVQHPGTHEDPFMGPAYLKAEAVLYRELHIGIDKASRLWS